MKALVLAMGFLSVVSAFAFECNYREAQFKGHVKEIRKVRVDQMIFDCHFKIEMTEDYSVNQMCPLRAVDAEKIEFFDDYCQSGLILNQPIDGYIKVLNSGQVILESAQVL